MGAVPPDYDSDPGRWASWKPTHDVHDVVAPEVQGPVLDVGCGEGRLASLVAGRDVVWIGVDASRSQLERNPHRPVVLADMRRLPFRGSAFREVTHLWCLYHLDDPRPAIAEALRVLEPGGRYFACTGARASDPELVPEGYPPSSFDAEEAAQIVAGVFGGVDAQRWDEPLYPLSTRSEVRAYCRHHFLPVELAEGVDVPLWLTKRGVLVRATKERPPPAEGE